MIDSLFNNTIHGFRSIFVGMEYECRAAGRFFSRREEAGGGDGLVWFQEDHGHRHLGESGSRISTRTSSQPNTRPTAVDPRLFWIGEFVAAVRGTVDNDGGTASQGPESYRPDLPGSAEGRGEVVMDRIANGRPYLFQQDSAPALKAKTTQAWLPDNVPHHWRPDSGRPPHQTAAHLQHCLYCIPVYQYLWCRFSRGRLA